MSKQTTPTDQKMSIRIIFPTGIYYAGEAVSLSAINPSGPFDILPGHTNFFSLLKEGIVTINTGKDQLKLPLRSGVLKFERNQLLLLGIS